MERKVTIQIRIASIIAVTGLCLVLSGCVSTDLVQTMTKDIDRLKQQTSSLRQEVDALGLEVAALKGTPDEEVEEGENGVTEAVGVGEVEGATSDDLEIREGVVEGEVDVDIEDAQPGRLNAEEVYATAQGLYAESRYREAYQAFYQASFLDRDKEFLGRCHYWMGECMFAQGAYQRALDHFGTVFGEYVESSKAPDALLKIGFTYYEMNNYNGARQALNEFLGRYPDHRAAYLAEERLNRMTYKESGRAERDH